MIPYISWSVISSYIYKGVISPFAFFSNITGKSSLYLWYLPTLFGLILIMSITEWMVSRLYLKIPFGGGIVCELLIMGCCTGIVILGFMNIGLRLFREMIIYIFPFYLGMAVKKYSRLSDLYTNHAVTMLCIIISFFLIPVYSYDDKSIPILAARFIAGLAFTEVIFCFVYSLKNNSGKAEVYQWCIKMFSYFGQHSLEIYIIHSFFRSLFTESIMVGIFQDTLLRAGYSIVICFASILIASLLKQSKYLALLLFGRK